MKKSSYIMNRHAFLLLLLSIPVFSANTVQIDLQTMAGLTIDRIYPYNTEVCQSASSIYVKGGNTLSGQVQQQSSEGQCTLGFINSDASPAHAINQRDHIYAQSNMVPTVVDFGSKQKTVTVFSAMIRTPVPEQALKKTVWGSDYDDVSNFPNGWTMATLNTIWKKGFTDAETCKESPESDDYAAQYTFPKKGHRYIAVYGNASVSIFKTRDHVTWNTENDDHISVIGWQSHDEETDAVLAPICQSIPKANAGPDKKGSLGSKICFQAIKTPTEARNLVINYGWDVDDNGTIDVTQEQACVRCDAKKSGKMRLYVTDQCGCTDTDAVNYNCTNNAPAPEEEARAPESDEPQETIDDSEVDEASSDRAEDERDEEGISEMDSSDASLRRSGDADADARRGPGVGPQGGPGNEGGFNNQGFGNQGGDGQGDFNNGGNMGNGQNMNNGMQNPYGRNGFNSGMPYNGLSNANLRTRTHMSGSGTPPILATSKSPGCSTTQQGDYLLNLVSIIYCCIIRLRQKNPA